MSGSGLRVGSLFITGANRGIGLEFVKQLTQLPQPPKHIFATCRNPDAAMVPGHSPGVATPEACLALFFYEILAAASVECSSRIVEVASCYEISRARNFFATFC